jgi:hypothetical protein
MQQEALNLANFRQPFALQLLQKRFGLLPSGSESAPAPFSRKKLPSQLPQKSSPFTFSGSQTKMSKFSSQPIEVLAKVFQLSGNKLKFSLWL